MINPKIIFIDSPNGAGKDYFINNFIEKYKQKYPEHKITTLIAKNFLPKHISQGRHYSNDKSLSTGVDKIFLGHLNLLTEVNELVQSRTTDLVIINRSILTFLAYNLNTQNNDLSFEQICIMKQEKEDYSILFSRIFKNIFKTTPSLFVNLTVFGDIETKIKILTQRLQARSDNKPIDKEQLNYLIDSYDNVNDVIKNTFTIFETLESGSYSYILNKYFT